MPNRFEALLETVTKTGVLSESERREIQRTVYDDGKVTLEEADTLFAINDRISREACPEWPWVFIGAVTDLLVRQSFPTNHIDAAESVWLIQRISSDGLVKTDTELELLLNILKYAQSAPDQLEKFALDQVKAHVLSNGFVTAEDVERLRQVLYACGSSGGVGITQMEAECLFDIADATEGATNDESFTDLFVGAVANHLMMSTAPAKLSYEEHARREYWLHERGEIRSGWKRVMKNPLSAFRQGRSEDEVATPVNEMQGWLQPQELRQAEAITSGESRWLIDRLNRDGKLSSSEERLLAFLAEESPDIHASLATFVPRAA